MNGDEKRADFFSSLVAVVIGVSTVFILFRKNPVFSIASLYSGSFDILAAGLVILSPFVLVLALRSFPTFNKWAMATFLGISWAFLSVGVTEGIQAASSFLLILTVTFFGAVVSFSLSAARSELFLWGPSILLLAHQFGLTILQGSLPEGFLGRGTGSIAFGHLMAIGFFMTYFLSKLSTRNGNFLFAGSVMFMIGVMLSGSRGALLGTFVGFGLILLRVYLRAGWVQTLAELKRFVTLGLITVSPFLLAAIVSGGDGGPAVGRKLIETFQISERFGSIESPIYTAGRLEIWATTLQEISHPMAVLFGSGKSVVGTSFGNTYPHNLFLELALAGGLLTMVPVILFLASVFRKMYEPGLDQSFDFFLFAAITLVFSMFSGDLVYNAVFFYFLGLCYGRIRKNGGNVLSQGEETPSTLN